MLLFNSCLGIDFKRNHLILTLLRKSLGKIRLVDYRIYPLWSEGQKEVQEAQWLSLITTFISRHQINKERVFVSIPREKVIVRFLRLPAATKENLRKVLEYEVPKYTPFDREAVYLDYQILAEEKDWLRLAAVFVKKTELDPYLALLKKIGIQPMSIQIPSVAALNLFFYHEREKEHEMAVLLDLSEPFLEMNLLRDKDWKESFHLSSEAAKREENILSAFRKSGGTGDSLSRTAFFVYGLDAGENTLPQLGEKEQVKEVSRPPLDRIEVGKNETKPDYIYPSIGIPLAGLTKTRLQLNLLPMGMRKKMKQIAKPLSFVLAAAVLVLGFTWGLGIYGGYQKELAALRTEVKRQKPEVETVERLQRQGVETGKEITEFEKIASGEVPKVDILRELTQILPGAVWIWNLKYTGKEVEISGYADSASELIPLLDKSPFFEKVEFMSPVTKERERRVGGEKERERFKIKMKLEGRGGRA